MNALKTAAAIATIISTLLALAGLVWDFWRIRMRKGSKKRPHK